MCQIIEYQIIVLKPYRLFTSDLLRSFKIYMAEILPMRCKTPNNQSNKCPCESHLTSQLFLTRSLYKCWSLGVYSILSVHFVPKSVNIPNKLRWEPKLIWSLRVLQLHIFCFFWKIKVKSNCWTWTANQRDIPIAFKPPTPCPQKLLT